MHISFFLTYQHHAPNTLARLGCFCTSHSQPPLFLHSQTTLALKFRSAVQGVYPVKWGALTDVCSSFPTIFNFHEDFES